MACSQSKEGEEATLQALGAAGEFPSFNELTAPEGAARLAENVVVDYVGKYTTHTGLEATANSGHVLSSFTLYQGGIVAHSQEDSLLLRYSGGVWAPYSGTYAAPIGSGRVSFQEASGALFFTTSTGLYRLDGLTGTPVLSGLPQALPGTAALKGDASGFLGENEATAYLYSWAYTVDDGGTGRLIEGAPSPRLFIANGTLASDNVRLTIPIPTDLPPGAYLRVFRADSTPADIAPLNEVRQIYEREPNATELGDGEVVVEDITPDTVKGAGAYFSANTGEGLAQSNFRAPVALGLTEFAESIFAIQMTGVQRLQLNALGAEAISHNQDIIIFAQDASFGELYRAANAENFPDFYKRFTGGVPAQDIALTVDSLCRAINSRADGALYAFPADTDGTNPGAFIVMTRALASAPFEVITDGNGQAFTPALQERRGNLAIERTAGVVTVTFVPPILVAIPFLVADDVDLQYNGAPDPDFPAGRKTITAVTATTISYNEAGPDVAQHPAGGGFISSIGAPPVSQSGTANNAFAWSKRYEPDHWPLANLDVVGGPTDDLLWGVKLDRYLFLGSEAGLYRREGNANDGFSSPDEGAAWDSNVRFLGRRNVATLDGRAYALAQEGLIAWTEGSKPRPVDAPIQEEIRARILAFPEVVAEHGFLYADPVGHRLYLAMPTASTDTAATVLHVFNGLSSAWTRLTGRFPGLEGGVVAGMAPADGAGKMYLIPSGDVAEEGPVYLSRLTGTNADYQGPGGEAILSRVQYVPFVAGEPSKQKQWTWSRIFTEAPTTAIRWCYATELVPEEECQSLPEMDPERTSPVPVEEPVRSLAWKTMIGAAPGRSYQRAKSLTVAVEHETALEPLRLLGVEVKHRAYGSGQ